MGALSCDIAYSGSPTSCDCCSYYDVATYTRCDDECEIEGYPSAEIDVCAWGTEIAVPFKPSKAPSFIKIEIAPGLFCCYEKS